jgi:hypothetical protein
MGRRFVEGRSVEGRYVEGHLVGRTFCSEGRFVEGRFVVVPCKQCNNYAIVIIVIYCTAITVQYIISLQ